MPDPWRKPRVGATRIAPRVVAHLLVLTMLGGAVVAGLGDPRGQPASRDAPLPGLSIVSTARAADHEADPEATAVHAKSHPSDLVLLTPRAPGRSDRAAPAPPVPLPTPVPGDPNATPLPAPAAVGQTSDSAGASTGFARGIPVLTWPVPNGGRISQYFTAGHLALDIPAPTGTQVVSAGGGVVTSAGWRTNGGGLVVEIDHGNGMVTIYNHLGSIWVAPGQSLAAGQAIGGIGCTGVCTGPHTHFELVVNGQRQNPLRFF